MLVLAVKAHNEPHLDSGAIMAAAMAVAGDGSGAGVARFRVIHFLPQ